MNSGDPLEGIYYYADSSYEIAIIKSKNEFRDYAGIMLNSKNNFWKPGQVKLELQKISDTQYKSILYMRDHSVVPQTYSFDGARLSGFGTWSKAGTQGKATAGKTITGFKGVD